MKNLQHGLCVMLAMSFLAGAAWAETHTAASCSYADVSAAITAASPGDTVIVPAGSATWNTCLTITKGIILKGAGIDKTVITTNNTNAFAGIIKYQPASPESNEPFRITGFTLNGNNKSNCIYLQNYTTTIINQVRVDHNRIYNASGRCFYILGTVYGVIDNNILQKNASGHVSATSSYGLDGQSWANMTRNFGSRNNIYFEDNTVTGDSFGHASGQGGRYACRYNTYSGATKNIPSVFEFHGNQPGGEPPGTPGNASTMVVEIYGNLIDETGYGSGNFIDARGGQAMIFFNKLINSVGSYMSVREEYPDDLWPVNDGSWIQHVSNTHYWANWKSGPSLLVPSVGSEIGPGALIDWQSAHDYGHSNIYHFRFNGDPNGYSWKLWNPKSPYLTGSTQPNWSSCAIRDKIQDGNVYWLNLGSNYGPLTENVDFWTQKPGTFDGTGTTGGGIGCGPLANRPTTCTPGVAYWATDQDCSNIADMVGAHPKTPLSGTLYKCTAPNVWTAYYTPYTYPHPLRTEGPTADLSVTGFDVQKGITGRSFIRYVDLTFNMSDGVADLVTNNRVQLTKYPLDGSGSGTPVSLSGVISANGNQMNLDFGPKGLGGSPNTTQADGYYDLTLDLDGDGQFETHRRFYCLMGDVDGDRNVTVADANLILKAYRQQGPLLNEDANGDGSVSALDRTMTARNLNRKLANGLTIED